MDIFYYYDTKLIHSMIRKSGRISRISPQLASQGLCVVRAPDEAINWSARYVILDEENQFVSVSFVPPQYTDLKVAVIPKTAKTIVFRRRGPGLGDVVMTLSAVQQMRYSQCPNSQIIYWGSKTFVEILYHHPAIHQIITDAESVPEKATIINLDDPCPAAKYESLCNGNIAKSRHELFTLASGLSWIGEIPRLYLSREEEVWAAEFIGTNGKANIGIEVKSAERWRDYPHCEVLAAELLKMDFNVYAFDKEESLAISGVKNITGFPLRRVMALISKMNVIICPDSALGHIAGAMGIPLIGLFGPTCATKRIEIYGGRWISTKCPKMPCWYNYCNGRNNFSPCMEKIKIKDIINHLRELKNDKSQKIRNWFRG